MHISLGKNDTLIEMSINNATLGLKECSVDLQGYTVDFPGEYERNLIFVEARKTPSGLLYIITLENRTTIYLPASTTTESLDVLRDVNNKDIVIMPANEHLWKTVETWEASVIVPYGAGIQEFLKKLGQTVDPNSSVSIKSTDFETEITRFIALG